MIQIVRDRMKRSLRVMGTGAILAMVFLQAADAGKPPIYDVEIIVFLNNKSNAGGENMRSPRIKYPSDYGRSFPEGEFTELSYQFYQLTNIAEKLDQSSDYNVLFHRAWRQLAYNKKNAIPYPVDSLVNSENKSLTGSVKLVLERYLHLDVDVLLMSNSRPGNSPTEHPILQLKEKRRIRNNQIHYFDHPYLSMIAKVTPYRKNENGEISNPENISFLRWR